MNKNQVRMKIICPHCEHNIKPNSKFCSFCGNDISSFDCFSESSEAVNPEETIFTCYSCHGDIGYEDKFCRHCGMNLREERERQRSVWVTQELEGILKSLERIYLQQNGIVLNVDWTGSLFPGGWATLNNTFLKIRCVAEAIEKEIKIAETRNWLNLRDSP